MIVSKLGLVDLIDAIQRKVEAKTGLRCYDDIPSNVPGPFYFAEIIGRRPQDTKVMWCEVFRVKIHVIAEPPASNVQVYDLIAKLEDSLTEAIEIPEKFRLLLQISQGLQMINKDETSKQRATLAYDFKICYGFRCK